MARRATPQQVAGGSTIGSLARLIPPAQGKNLQTGGCGENGIERELFLMRERARFY